MGVGARAGRPIPEYDFILIDPVGECASARGGFGERGRAAGVGDPPGGDTAAVVEFEGESATGN